MHQPWRYREYTVFESGHNHDYWQDKLESAQSNERIFKKVAEKSYRPTLDMLEKNLKKHKDFAFSLSITGTWLEQAELFAPDLIKQLKRMVKTGRVEIVGETYYHSMAFFYDKEEFAAQVKKHQEKIFETFGVKTRVFRNTELAYNDEVGEWAEKHGFAGVLAEGWDKVLKWRSPNYVYKGKGCKRTKILLKNYRLSDDIAFRFSDRRWKEWPLTVDKYLNWVEMDCLRGNLVNLFMDFETFGEHQWKDTGIFEFMDDFIGKWLSGYGNKFLTVAEACKMQAVDEISMPATVTWADTERDLSAWMGNALQTESMADIYALRQAVLKNGNAEMLEDFRRLTTSDHAYYMCTKYWNDGDVHAYFSAYASPYDAFMYYMNVLRDLKYRLGVMV